MYGKIFSSIYDGTLGTRGPWQALIVFQQMIVLADREGIVDMTPEALARRTTLPLEIVKEGIRNLLKPDKDSRTPDEQGRRIVPLADNRGWGWRVVNYDKYRKIRSADDRREYMRQFMAKKRAVSNVSRVSRSKPMVDVDVDVIKEKEYAPQASPSNRGTRLPPDWKLPSDWFEIGATARAGAGLPPLDINLEADKFKDYWLGKSGKDGCKNDWLATWRNWCRNSKSNGALNGNSTNRGTPRSLAARSEEAERIAAKMP